MQTLIAHYLQELALKRANPLSTDELSLRDALSEFLNESAKSLGKKVQFVGEGKKIAQGTRPDYIVTRSDLPIGYIEAEKYGLNLTDLKGHAKTQNAAFIHDLDNFLLTNHLEFRLYSKGETVAHVVFPAHAKDLSEKHENDWQAFCERFLSGEPETIANPKDLAILLSRRARLLASAALEDLQVADESPVDFAFEQFKRELLTDIDKSDFADVYAETLTYGLFAAKCLSKGSFTIGGAAKTLKTIPLLSSLFLNYEHQLDDNLRWILDEIVALLDAAPIEKITDYFQNRVGRADPMLDFYEPFLAAFDPHLRESRGVYYTPEPVVGYMVRSVSQLLKREFNRNITDKDVQILDPATGTGSFLFAVVDEIHRQLADFGAWDSAALETTLARLFGLELMVAPYTVAHLKLRLQLESFGPKPKGRIGIYLSNTLDDPRGSYGGTVEMASELKASDKIKSENEILVVLGNPPYSGHSSNITTRIEGGKKVFSTVGARLERYKTVDGVPLGEKNPKWLQDDYVKFLAFAQNRIERTGEGIVAFITNHGYLDNPTFRGLRASLMDSFDSLYVLDLHGNAKKKEVAPDGGKDKNVFDIQQGVSILFAVKKQGQKTARAEVFHADLWGERPEKYAALQTQDITTTDWRKLAPTAPQYFFIPRDDTHLIEYEKGWKVTDIFGVNVLGFQTHRDHFAISFEQEDIESRAKDFRGTSFSNTELAAKYNLKDNRDWQIEKARRQLRSDENWSDKIIECDYRPFDTRFCFFGSATMDFPRRELLDHVLNRENWVLNTTRQTRTDSWANAIVTKNPSPAVFVEIKDGSNVFPLYLYSDGLFGPQRTPNLNPKFTAELAKLIGFAPTPEAIFAYIYAVLHGPIYREKYAAFLKSDFPRIPLPRDKDHFETLEKLGEKLVALHLLDVIKAPELESSRYRPHGEGANVVVKAEYDAAQNRLHFTPTRYFENVPQQVWEFKIGGYQVAKKWLDDRKGRTLEYDDLVHYAQTLIALEATIALMLQLKILELASP